MWLKLVVPLVLLTVCAVQADLPSCYRARCSHCSVLFIAQMCPNICASCYGTDPQRIPNGPRIRAGNASYRPIHLATGSTSLPSQPRIHGQPTSNTGPSHHSLSSQTSVRHGLFSSSNPNQENQGAASPSASKAPLAQSLPIVEAQPSVVQPQPQYHHQFSGAVQQVSSNTGPQTPQLPQYPVANSQPAFQTQPNLGQSTAFGSSYAPAAAVPPTQYAAQAQPSGSAGFNPSQNQAFSQPQYFAQAQQQPQQSVTFFEQQQTQQSLPQALPQQQQFSQGNLPQTSFGQQQQGAGGQQQLPANSPFANPFQPFLQQSYVAQQQPAFFQPFTVATPAPFVTPAPVPAPQTFQGLPTGNQVLDQPSAQQQLLAQPGYGQPANRALVPTVEGQKPQQALANSQYTYGPQVLEAQRPRQIYNGASNLPAAHLQPLAAPLAPSPAAVAVALAKPNRFTAVPTAMITASNSIDPAAMYVNKNGYAEKSGGAFPQPTTCSKQPNWEPCISKDIANQRFSNCCQKLGEGCSQLCSYDQTLTVLQLAVLTGRCPIGKVADMMICASGYEDATACCQAHNVFEMGFEHCRPYCNPAAGLPNDGMLAEKYRCLGKLSQIQRCFYVLQKP